MRRDIKSIRMRIKSLQELKDVARRAAGHFGAGLNFIEHSFPEEIGVQLYFDPEFPEQEIGIIEDFFRDDGYEPLDRRSEGRGVTKWVFIWFSKNQVGRQ